MTEHLLATVILPNINGIPKDSFVNTFALETPTEIDPADLPFVADAVTSLYTGREAGEIMYGQLGDLLGNQVSRAVNAAEVKLYDITGKEQNGAPDENGRVKPPPHGSPIYVDTWTVPTSEGSESLPSQIAAVVTLRSRTALESPVEDGSVRPRQRGTGRFYFGPLNNTAVTGLAGNPIASNRLMNDAVFAVEHMQEQLNSLGYALSVWSRTRGMLSVVTSAECDNALDVIRSRRLKPTVRTKRVLAPVPDLALGA